MSVPHLFDRETVCLGDDGDEVDLVLQPLEELEVDLPQPVPVRWDEVEAGVHPGVNDALAIQPALALEISRKKTVILEFRRGF